jgi:hypothetical protein
MISMIKKTIKKAHCLVENDSFFGRANVSGWSEARVTVESPDSVESAPPLAYA